MSTPPHNNNNNTTNTNPAANNTSNNNNNNSTANNNNSSYYDTHNVFPTSVNNNNQDTILSYDSITQISQAQNTLYAPSIGTAIGKFVEFKIYNIFFYDFGKMF
jgi:hypothetical protein